MPGLGVPHAPCKSAARQGRGAWVFSKFQDPRRGDAGHAGTAGTLTWRPHQGGRQHPAPARQPRQRPQLPSKGGSGADAAVCTEGTRPKPAPARADSGRRPAPCMARGEHVPGGDTWWGDTRTKAGSRGRRGRLRPPPTPHSAFPGWGSECHSRPSARRARNLWEVAVSGSAPQTAGSGRSHARAIPPSWAAAPLLSTWKTPAPLPRDPTELRARGRSPGPARPPAFLPRAHRRAHGLLRQPEEL